MRLATTLGQLAAAIGACGLLAGFAAASGDASLRTYLKSIAPDHTTTYSSARVDLNGDGVAETLVYLEGQSWCGSGGCSLLVLEPDHATWRKISHLTLTRLPVRALNSKSHGWSDLSVQVSGGGLATHEVLVPYDGKGYAENPSVAPARELSAAPAGRTVIAPLPTPKPLY